MPKITIVETGLVPPEHRARHGSFPQMFERMIGAVDASASFATVRLLDGDALPDPAGLDAILITGSPAGVYDDLDWIAPLERFVRAAYETRVSMVGVCFGHQLMAQALGGTVRKSEKGWGIGRHVYDVVPNNGVIARCRCSRIPNSPWPLRMFVARKPARTALPRHWSHPPRLRWTSHSITPTSAARSRAFWQGRAKGDFRLAI